MEQPPRQNRPSPLEQAEEALLAKGSKIDLAQKAVYLKNLADIAHDDVSDVRKLKAKHLGPEFAMANGAGGGGAEDGMGDVIVCDDYHHHHNNGPQGTGNAMPQVRGTGWPLAIGLLGGGGLIATSILGATLLIVSSRKDAGCVPVKPTVPPNAGVQNNPTTTIERSGFIIDLPGAKR